MGTITFSSGDQKLTRRVQKLAADAAVDLRKQVRWSGRWHQVVGYTVDEAVYRLAVEQIAAEDAAKKARSAKRAEKERVREERWRAGVIAEHAADVAARCPWLAGKPLGRLVAQPHLFTPASSPRGPEAWLHDSCDSVPHGQYTRAQWQRLGYSIRRGSRPVGYVAIDRRLLPLYDRYAVAPACEPVSGEQAWEHLVRHYGGDESLALARSVWAANRLVKLDGRGAKRRYYYLKDRFLEIHAGCLVEGREARVEERLCRGCWGPECDRCGGTGVYSTDTLYEWHMVIDGHSYCYHSYARPPIVSTTPGADLPSYGRRFTDADLADLPAVPLAYYMAAIEHRLDVLQRASAPAGPAK